MYCQKCGNTMKLLPDLYPDSGKSWFGCERCGTVIEYNYCSMTGRSFGANPCHLSYQEFMERIAKNKAK